MIRQKWISAVVLALALVPAMVKLISYPHNIGSDDAYIHLRVATEFLRGEGWGINPHQPVNLSTAPAFTLLLVLVEKMGRHPVYLAQAFSCVASALGLLAIFGAAFAETTSMFAALLAEGAAAFSVNLWRWNGTLMETSFAFAMVAGSLWFLRKDVGMSAWRAALLGVLLGFGMLLRPELGLLACLAAATLVRRSEPGSRARNGICVTIAAMLPLLSWYAFAHRQGISPLPTTYAAKSVTGVLLLNRDFAMQFAQSLGASLLLPVVFVLLVVIVGGKKGKAAQDSTSYWVPAGLTAALFTFYYLKMPGLESPGRYLLPLLPCEALLLALLWQRFRAGQGRFVAGVLVLHALFSLELNRRTIAPVLRRFEGEYGDTQRAAAAELVRLTAGQTNRRVLVVSDIGLLSCEGDGRFEIVDGGALATPALRGLSTKAQIERVRPAFVVQTLSRTPQGFAADLPEILHPLWRRRFLQHGVRVRDPFYYTIIFEPKGAGG